MPFTSHDRQQVQDLMTRYAFAVDGGTEADFFDIFTDDAVLDGPWGIRRGRDGVLDLARRVTERKSTVQLRHLLTNMLVEGEGDSARVRAYFVEFRTPIGQPSVSDRSAAELLHVGTYDCAAIKVSGVWRLHHRLVHVDAS
jgi:3-phenylpropionate/cinnamic acid dioxygenase small subunit